MFLPDTATRQGVCDPAGDQTHSGTFPGHSQSSAAAGHHTRTVPRGHDPGGHGSLPFSSSDPQSAWRDLELLLQPAADAGQLKARVVAFMPLSSWWVGIPCWVLPGTAPPLERGVQLSWFSLIVSKSHSVTVS